MTEKPKKTKMVAPAANGYNTQLLAVKNLLYALSYAPEKSERIYYYLLLDSEREAEFKKAIAGHEPFNLKDYATIIASGYGEPPEDLKEQLKVKYNVVLE